MKKLINLIADINIILGVILITSPLPVLAYKISAQTEQSQLEQSVQYETDVIANTPFQEAEFKKLKESANLLVSPQTNPIWVPVIPEGSAISYKSRIRIPSIGLDTEIFESAYAEHGLIAGVWRMPEHGTPQGNGPMVLAAHRWGLDTNDEAFRTKNLFLKLPDLRAGDIITINWNNKIYKYEMTSLEVNDHVSKLDDLILVTCEDYSSPMRIIVYAKHITDSDIE